MKNKNNSNTSYVSDNFELADHKYPGKTILSKFDYELFNEDKNISEKIVRVKRTGTTETEERWRIFEDNKLVFVLEGSKLLKKEKEFLRTVDGVSFLIACQKNGGIKSLNGIRKGLKNSVDKKK